MLVVTAALGLHFNVGKCSSLMISKEMANPAASLHIRGVVVRSLDEGENEDYLGVPIGNCPHSAQLLSLLASSIGCRLRSALCQKLEVFCAHLLPLLSHHLATSRVQRGFLDEID